jgi:peptide/nickel transport system permease protein
VARYEGALEAAGLEWEGLAPQRPRPFPQRALGGLAWFCSRKPLGAFGGVLVLLLLLMALLGPGLRVGPLEVPRLAPYHYNQYDIARAHLERFQSPSLEHPMGTDQRGRDVLSRLLYGARISVAIGLGAFIISTVLSTTLTLISAYYLRSVDLLLQRLIEMFNFIPDLLIIGAIFAIKGGTPLTLALTLGVLGGLNTGRVLRAEVIRIRGLPYVDASKAMGASDGRIIFRHILPNVMFWIIVSATNAVSVAIVAEANLAVLGFGLDPALPTWGNMLDESREYVRQAPHLAIFSGLMVAMTIFGFRLLGDALRDVLDPRLHGARQRP